MPGRIKTKKRLTILFIVLSLLCLLLAGYFAMHRQTVIMDFRLPDREQNAVQTSSGGVEVEVSEGGGAGAVTYSNIASYNKRTKTLTLNFENPSNSPSSMVISIVVDGNVIYESGLLPAGYGIQSVPNLDLDLPVGSYEGKFSVEHYNPDTREKAMFNLEVDMTLNVNE